jgi:hypothetical protein
MFGVLLSLWQRESAAHARSMRPSWMLSLAPAAPTVAPTATSARNNGDGNATTATSTSSSSSSALGVHNAATSGVDQSAAAAAPPVALVAWPPTGTAPVRAVHACAFLTALYLSKKAIAQAQSKHRKIARACVDRLARATVARCDRIRQFDTVFPELVRRLIRQVLCEQPAANLERILDDMLFEVSR